MNEFFNQISLEALAMIFQIFAAISIGVSLLLALASFVGIAWQMVDEARSKSAVTGESSRFGLLRG